MNSSDVMTVTCLVDDVCEGLCVVPLELFDNIGCLHVRDDRPNDREKFILGDGAADQTIQGSFVGIGDERRSRGLVHIPWG